MINVYRNKNHISVKSSYHFFCRSLEMNARDMASGASNYRDGMQDGERGQQKVSKSGNGSGDESSDSSSSNKERGRKKQKNNEENRKEPIQGNTFCINKVFKSRDFSTIRYFG